MTVYVDELENRGWWAKKGGSCHMASDTSETELLAFARALGLPDGWYQQHPIHPHYDLNADWRRKALLQGAREATNVDFVKRCSRIFNPAIARLS